jgi:hypothetical protein
MLTSNARSPDPGLSSRMFESRGLSWVPVDPMMAMTLRPPFGHRQRRSRHPRRDPAVLRQTHAA